MRIVIESATDCTTLNISPCMLCAGELSFIAQNTSLLNDGATFSLFNPLPYVSLLRNDDLFDAFELSLKRGEVESAGIAVAYKSFVSNLYHDDYRSKFVPIPSNYPQISNMKGKFKPMLVDKTVHIVSKHTPGTVKNCKVLWVKQRTMDRTLTLAGSIPYIISGKSQKSLHTFGTIDARACDKAIDLHHFAQKFFMHPNVCLARKKTFYIKRLLLPTKEYTDVYGQQLQDLTFLYCNQVNEKEITLAYVFKKGDGWCQRPPADLAGQKRSEIEQFLAWARQQPAL